MTKVDPPKGGPPLTINVLYDKYNRTFAVRHDPTGTEAEVSATTVKHFGQQKAIDMLADEVAGRAQSKLQGANEMFNNQQTSQHMWTTNDTTSTNSNNFYYSTTTPSSAKPRRKKKKEPADRLGQLKAWLDDELKLATL